MDIKNIKMLISDVDGVWTDGSFYKGTDNIELKKFSVFDGVGVAMARAAKIRVALISGRFSSATEHRAKELGIEDVYNGCLNKLPAYEELKSKYQLNDNDIAYIGDDLIDIPVMDVSEMTQYVKDYDVKIAIIAVPAETAQEVANSLVNAGVQAFLNFSSTVLKTPDNVIVNSVDLALELEHLSYFVK